MSEHDPSGPLPERPLFYTVSEAARTLRLGRSTIYRHIKSGQLKLSRVGGIRVVIHRDELARLIENEVALREPPPLTPPKRRRRH